MFETFSVALAAILSIFCIVGAGVYFRRTGRLTPQSEQPLLRLTVDLLLPCLIFDRVLRTDAFVINPQNLWLPPLLGYGLVTLGILFGLGVGLLSKKINGMENWKQKRTFASCVGNYNYGFVPIPLVIAMIESGIFPEGDRLLGVLFVQNLGVELAVWTIILFTIQGKLDGKSLRQAVNMPSIAIVLSVSLNLLGNSAFIPAAFHEHVAPRFDFLLMAISLLGAAGIPMSIILTAAVFADHFHRKELKERLGSSLKISFWSILIRLVAMPMIFIALAIWLPCTVEIKKILVIHGASGSAIFTMVLSKHYGGDPKTAFDTIMSNSILTVLTLPVWIAVGLHLI